ncbi:MAG TPA: DinB family protein [Vicinamibacteria bacterium]|nr:DinB family protein [Vicinamibacteria bacterium]
MKMTDLLTAQLEREAAISRRALERVPEGRPDWKPHEKSMPLGYLATLVATMPSWIAMAINQDELDLNPPSGPKYEPPEWATTPELLQTLDESAVEARDALRKTTDAHLTTPWRLLVGGRVAMEAPRHVVIADTFTHLAHHRGQLTVYLRLNGAAVPSIYGPSADDGRFAQQ